MKWWNLVWLSLFLVTGPLHGSTQTLSLNNATTERVVVENDPMLNPVSGITIEAWIRPNTVTGCQTVVGKGYFTAYWLGICSGVIRYYANGFLSAEDGNQMVSIGEWTHIAVAFDGSERRYYVNGELDFSAAYAATSGINSEPLGIGGEGGSLTYPDGLFPFAGRISEVRLWNYARSELQVRDTMYQQITSMQPGLIGVWPLEGAPDDRFGQFHSVLAPGAAFSGIQSPPKPHEPLAIRAATSIAMNGDCSDAGYGSSTVMPAWYEDADRLVIEPNPLDLLIGADASYVYVCLPNRKQLTDPIYSVEIDTDNDGDSLLDASDRRFRYWPGDDGLTTAVGELYQVGMFSGWRWSDPGLNPSGLAAAEDLSIEFTTDFEMRIPRWIFSDPSDVFRMRISHNFLVTGPDGDRTVLWPVAGGNVNPATWQEVAVDLTSPPAADSDNPRLIRFYIDDDRPRFTEEPRILVRASDNVDIELVEILVDGVVVASMEYTGADDTHVELIHQDSYPIGRHNFSARVFDHAGRETRSDFMAFRVDVDGEPPRVGMLVLPRNPAAGQTVTVTAFAIDPSEVRSLRIESLLGGHLPTAVFCDFPAGGTSEICVWNVDPGPDLTMARLQAFATDAEGYSDNTADYLVLWGNFGPDDDDDGLTNFTESGMCTDANNPDTDGDGLSDGWEVLGIQFAGGSELPLPEYGANPCYKNIFLQLDYETGARPPTSGIDNLINQHRDRETAVYVETNSRPRPTAYDQSHIGAIDAAYQLDGSEYYLDPRRLWAFYYGYERNLQGRSGAANRFFTVDHHASWNPKGYCASGSDQGKECAGDFHCAEGASCAAGCTDGDNKGMSCTAATDCPMDDGSFARCTAPCVTNPLATGTTCAVIGDLGYRLFHELGHTMGLGHGGMLGTLAVSSDGGFVTVDSDWDNYNFKPHQMSAMNYYYSQGLMCMTPPPSPIPDGYRPEIAAEIAFMDETLGDLNETRLFEASTSQFAVNLRSQDCSFADPGTFPVFRYSCTILDTQMEVISDGLATIAQRPKGASWNFDVPTHAPGIDWNCNGLIDSASVAENIDTSGWRFDGLSWDPALWVLDTNLRGRAEYPVVPKPVNCQKIWRANCADKANSCYPWPTDYQNAIPDLASGTEVVDCRDLFMDIRASHRVQACREGADSDFGTGVCPLFSLDTRLAGGSNDSYLDGWEDMGRASGPENDVGPVQPDAEPSRAIPGVEQCDMVDNDGDETVDENCRDIDLDGTPDVIDNCPTLANADQADRDSDGLGDACQFPQLNNLQAVWDGNRKIDLIWSNDGIPLQGAVIYRYGARAPRALYRGSGYPSSTGDTFSEEISVGDTYTYVVRPLNLNGEEGEPVSTEVLVSIDEIVFADGFENP